MNLTATVRSLRLYQLLGLLLMLLLFAGIGGWAAFASISGAVIAEARIVVETNPKKLQHPEGGVVSEILVADGARVEAGQLLLRLDETETRANLAIISAMLDELIARQARLEAERDGASDVKLPETFADRPDRATLSAALTGQGSLFAARRAAKQGEQEQLRYKIQQLGEEMRGLEAQQTSKERQLGLINSELTALKGLQDKGLIRLNRILALEREVARLEGERGSLIAQIGGKRGEISETHLRFIQIDKNLTSEIVTELRETQTKIAELTEKRVAAEIRLRRTEIRAPRSGIVYQLNVHTIGGVVAAGEQVMLIAPEQDALLVEARVRPTDIDQVKTGQRTTIRLHAFDAALTPEIIGEVAVVSPDSIADTQLQTQAHYYVVRIRIDGKELAKLGERPLLPGMLVEAFIETDTRTVLKYLLKPLSDRIAHAWRER